MKKITLPCVLEISKITLDFNGLDGIQIDAKIHPLEKFIDPASTIHLRIPMYINQEHGHFANFVKAIQEECELHIEAKYGGKP